MLRHLSALTLTLALATTQATAGSKEWVDGLGWVPSAVVARCLYAVGEEETDYLTDGKWDEFQSCVASFSRR